jgi:hypothetical protein
MTLPCGVRSPAPRSAPMKAAATTVLLLLAPSSVCPCDIVFEHMSVLSLDGHTCYLRSEGAAAALPMGASPYTLRAEIQTTFGGAGGKSPGILSWGDFKQDSVNALRLDADGEALQNYWFTNDLASPGDLQLHLADGEWHTVAAIWDGLTQTLVVDGKEVASRKPTTKLNVVSKSNFCVGASSELYDAKFEGRMRGIRIWSTGVENWPFLLACMAGLDWDVPL